MKPLTVSRNTDNSTNMQNGRMWWNKKNVTPYTPQLALGHMLRSLPQQERCRACWPKNSEKIVEGIELECMRDAKSGLCRARARHKRRDQHVAVAEEKYGTEREFIFSPLIEMLVHVRMKWWKIFIWAHMK